MTLRVFLIVYGEKHGIKTIGAYLDDPTNREALNQALPGGIINQPVRKEIQRIVNPPSVQVIVAGLKVLVSIRNYDPMDLNTKPIMEFSANFN